MRVDYVKVEIGDGRWRPDDNLCCSLRKETNLVKQFLEAVAPCVVA